MTIVRTVAPESRQWATTLQLRDTGVDGRYIEGVAAPFNRWEDIGPYDERLDAGVFDTSLQRNADKIPLMVQHESRDLPIGKPVEWRKSDAHLYGVWEFDSRTEAREVYRMADDGILTGLSVSFMPGKGKTSNMVERDGSDRLKVTRMHARLMEVSVVSVPAYEGAGITVVRTAGAEALEQLVVATPRLEAATERQARIEAMLEGLL